MGERSKTVTIFTRDIFLPIETIITLLKERHGIHGARFLNEALSSDYKVDLILESLTSNRISFSYKTPDGLSVSDTVLNTPRDLERAISHFVVQNCKLTLPEQSVREDCETLMEYAGSRPQIEVEPSAWIMRNPLMLELCKRFPKYENLVRFLCNERGLFLKVGQYPDQRAYWNSTMNGGLPTYRKSDPIHEGTFMLHDLFHFVPIDPIIGVEKMTPIDQAGYMAHRMLSESSTLVLADMDAIANTNLQYEEYNLRKRKIFPIYQSIQQRTGSRPTLDKLLAANAYFCFTGDPVGFKMLGASHEALSSYRNKYESIFQQDFIWNHQNLKALIIERDTNPLIMEYYEWLSIATPFPKIADYRAVIGLNEYGVDIPEMLSVFRADFEKAFTYKNSIDPTKRSRLAAQKYLAGQRLIFARFGKHVAAQSFKNRFDEAFDTISNTKDIQIIHSAINTACNIIHDYIEILAKENILLPHEVELYRFSVPTYPVRFVNYDSQTTLSRSELISKIGAFIEINTKQLERLLDLVAA